MQTVFPLSGAVINIHRAELREYCVSNVTLGYELLLSCKHVKHNLPTSHMRNILSQYCCIQKTTPRVFMLQRFLQKLWQRDEITLYPFSRGGKKTVQKKIKWKVIVLLKELFNLQQYWPRTHPVRRLHRTWIRNFWRYNWPARSFQSVKPMLEVDMHLLPIVSESCSASSLVHHLMEKFPERWKLYTAAY